MAFDPQKAFQWEPTDSFTLSGIEYSLLINSLREILNHPDSQKVLACQQAYSVLQSKLEEGYEKGYVKEVESDTKG